MGPADSERRQVAASLRDSHAHANQDAVALADSDRHTELHTRMAD